MKSNSVCNHTSDKQNRTTAKQEFDLLIMHEYDCRLNWTTRNYNKIITKTKFSNVIGYQQQPDLGINRPRSIYQYSNMAPRLSGHNSIFGVVFFVSKSLLGIERQKKLEKFAILTRKPRSHARILIYRTWPIGQCTRHACNWTARVTLRVLLRCTLLSKVLGFSAFITTF